MQEPARADCATATLLYAGCINKDPGERRFWAYDGQVAVKGRAVNAE